jgi:hypothetical protein
MTSNIDITKEYLHSVLNYNADSGVFKWKHRADMTRSWNARFSGTVAGTKNPIRAGLRAGENAYFVIVINKKPYLLHVLAWLYMTGEIAKNSIDHVDGNPRNNRWDNLRKCTKSENQCNRAIQSNNTSGYKGVSWDKRRMKWKAYIKINTKMIYLGRFDNIEDASDARIQAMNDIHGEFARVA